MIVYVIDPWSQSVEPLAIRNGQPTATEILETEDIDYWPAPEQGDVLVIDNGARHSDNLAEQRFFTLAGSPHAHVGRAIYMGIVGPTEAVNVREPSIDCAELERRVQWLTAHDILRLVCRIAG